MVRPVRETVQMTTEVEVATFDTAKFAVHVPVVTPLKGILVLTLGTNADARKDIPNWLSWAEQRHLAIVGCYFKDHEETQIERYVDAKEESGTALLSALDIFTTSYPQLAGKKLFMWGWSAGGEFNHEFNAHFPERVAGFVVNKGGVYYTALVSKKARSNPGLYILGVNDHPLRGVAIRGIYAVNVYAGAKWLLEEEPVEHELGASLPMAKRFFDHILGVTP